MNLSKQILAAVALIILTACTRAESDSVSDIHTQTFVGRSAEHLAFRGSSSMIHVQVYAGRQGQSPTYGLNVRRNAGFSRWAHYQEAWSFGKRLGFKGGQSKVVFCAAIGCDVVEFDQVIISKSDFESGLRSGMELRLVGSGDTSVIKVPAKAFKEALAKMP